MASLFAQLLAEVLSPISDQVRAVGADVQANSAAILRLEQKVDRMSNTMDQGLAQLADDVSQLKTTSQSAAAAITGLETRLAAAIAADIAAGANVAQLANVQALHTGLQQVQTDLAAAIASVPADTTAGAAATGTGTAADTTGGAAAGTTVDPAAGTATTTGAA
jgi:hypothetical protein